MNEVNRTAPRCRQPNRRAQFIATIAGCSIRCDKLAVAEAGVHSTMSPANLMSRRLRQKNLTDKARPGASCRDPRPLSVWNAGGRPRAPDPVEITVGVS